MSVRPIALAVLAAALLAACGSTSTSSSTSSAPAASAPTAAATTPPSATTPAVAPVIDVIATDTAYTAPTTMPAGVVALHFRNDGSHPHEFAFGRIEDGHSLAEFMALPTDRQGDVPWVHDEAGPPLLTPGAEITITRRLEPGTYFFFDGFPSPTGKPGGQEGLVASIKADGDSGAALPEASAVITAGKDGYQVPALHAGLQTIELRNEAGAGRGFSLATLNAGKTEADVEHWFGKIESTGRSPNSPAPVTFLGAIQTIPTGTSVFLTVDLEAGRSYHLSDDESGAAADFTPA
jgi:hypothetical protein